MIKLKKVGGPRTSIELRQKIYNHWVVSSDLSTDRRNSRHMIKIKKTKLNHSILDMDDENITETNTKRGLRLRAQKRIYSGNIRGLHSSFCKLYPSINISIGTYCCKPLYISPATEREMEGCLCIKCLNLHLIYNAIKKHMMAFHTHSVSTSLSFSPVVWISI